MISVTLAEVGYSQFICSWVIFGFLSWYPKFWFGKISTDFNPIYKIPIIHITSAHLTNFRSSYILPSGTKSNKKIGWKKCIFAMANLQTQKPQMRNIFPLLRQCFSIVQNRLWYPLETCILNRVWFLTESGSQIASYSVPILRISQTCPNRGYSQYICNPNLLI